MQSLISKYLLPIVAVAAAGWTVPAFATSGENSGGVENTFISSTSSFTQSPGDFLITLAGLNNLCAKSGFAYVNQTDANYNTIVNTIMEARTLRRTLFVYWTTDANGYCHITHVYF